MNLNDEAWLVLLERVAWRIFKGIKFRRFDVELDQLRVEILGFKQFRQVVTWQSQVEKSSAVFGLR